MGISTMKYASLRSQLEERERLLREAIELANEVVEGRSAVSLSGPRAFIVAYNRAKTFLNNPAIKALGKE